jgi:hypothetical protein
MKSEEVPQNSLHKVQNFEDNECYDFKQNIGAAT